MENEKVSAQVKVHILRNDFENYKEQVEEHFEATDEKVKNHQEMLVNNGRNGLMQRVAKLENAKEASSDRYAKVLSTLAVLLSLIAVVLQMLQNTK